mmetsp:Transcript_13392/g.33539  ORF Transcript_13392/g.33539 Transcript_13392/m.33539 type:complete len:310 (+) Transcript_13392:466-1395(+)
MYPVVVRDERHAIGPGHENLLHKFLLVLHHKRFAGRAGRLLSFRALVPAQSTHGIAQTDVLGTVRSIRLLENRQKSCSKGLWRILVGPTRSEQQRSSMEVGPLFHNSFLLMSCPAVQCLVDFRVGTLGMVVLGHHLSGVLIFNFHEIPIAIHSKSERLVAIFLQFLADGAIESSSPHEELLISRNQEDEVLLWAPLERISEWHIGYKLRKSRRENLTASRPPRHRPCTLLHPHDVVLIRHDVHDWVTPSVHRIAEALLDLHGQFLRLVPRNLNMYRARSKRDEGEDRIVRWRGSGAPPVVGLHRPGPGS